MDARVEDRDVAASHQRESTQSGRQRRALEARPHSFDEHRGAVRERARCPRCGR